MMTFMSLYTIVDGIFISRFVGSNALSSLNIVFPVITLAIAIGTMFSTGGNAVISKYLGEGNTKRACQCLTQFVLFCVSLSIVLVVLSILFASPISRFLGATDILIDDAVIYLRIVMAFAPACILQTLFQSYFVTAGHPGMGLGLMIVAGCTNAALDYVFIAAMHMGIAGAALATGIGQCIPAVAGVVFFLFTKKELRFTRCGFYPKETAKAAFNGSSEMVTELSTAIITFLFNIILLRLAGEHGVAAITILLYGEFLFNGFYLGFAIGISPIIGFQYGAQNRHELRRLYKIAFLFAAGTSLFMALLAFLLSGPITSVFTKDPQTYVLAVAGFKLFAVNFLFSGLNITSSGFFTALSNGKTSAIISFCRDFSASQEPGSPCRSPNFAPCWYRSRSTQNISFARGNTTICRNPRIQNNIISAPGIRPSDNLSGIH